MQPSSKKMLSTSYHKLPCWCFVEKVPIKPRVMNLKLIQLSSKYPIVSASCIYGFHLLNGTYLNNDIPRLSYRKHQSHRYLRKGISRTLHNVLPF